jgi:hypothetical protein
MNDAINKNDAVSFQAAFVELCDKIQENVIEQARGIVEEADQKILSERGVRQLTSKEKNYYQKLIEAMKSASPKQAVENLDVVMPYTVVDKVFEDLKANHPLLSKIQFTSVTGLTKMMMNTNGYQKAAWGKLCAEIVKELTSGFKEVDVTLSKLSAFLPVCKAMLDLGPEWLDKYVRQVLYEALANGLEDGIINGTGKDMPIGMMKQVGDSVTITGGVYPDKAPVKVTKFDNIQLGKLASILAINDKGQARVVDTLILVVNPSDYFSKILPATQYPAPGGGYVSALPFPIDIIQSPAVPVGKAVFGMAKLYFMGSGIENNGRILYSDDYHFLEDERVYLIKMYGHGFAMDDNAFIVLDITRLQPVYYKVEVVPNTADVENADLADLKIGGHALIPAFSPEHLTYDLETNDASNAVQAVAADTTAEIEITYNDDVIANGSRVTWTTGSDNVIKVKVTDGETTKTYQITVTKAEG